MTYTDFVLFTNETTFHLNRNVNSFHWYASQNPHCIRRHSPDEIVIQMFGGKLLVT